jgi:hypothetical protein
LSNSRYKDTGNTGNLNLINNNTTQEIPSNPNLRELYHPQSGNPEWQHRNPPPLSPTPPSVRIQQRPENKLRVGYDTNSQV